ncbi:MAG: DUF4397 domain-containing protein [Naasia sp.]
MRSAARSAAAIAITIMGALMMGVPAATAATSDPVADPGYVRFAHLSPDTTPLDARIAPEGADVPIGGQDALGYGGVSSYVPLPAGSYSVELVPSGAAEGTAPVVFGGLELAAGEAVTIAAIGVNDELADVVLEDDLSSPAAGLARVRAVNTAASSGAVDAAIISGVVLLDGSELGDSGEYTDIAPGPSELSLIADGTEDIASVDLAAGAVHTLFVVSDAQGILTVIPVVDAVAVAEPPVGGVATGGGALAEADGGRQTATLIGLGAIVALTASVIVLRVRRARGARAVDDGSR